MPNIPVLNIIARTLPEAWQQMILALYEQGADIPTAYDRPGDPPSKEATTQILVEQPFGEPRLHRKGMPAGLEELEVYRLEVIAGVHDHWIERAGEQWNYTYHERIRAYETPDGRCVDQIGEMVDLICKSEFPFGRRFQVITWMPWVDPTIIDPPCLQRLHFRLVPTEVTNVWKLNMSSDWRSRDAYKAWFMNAFALTDLQRLIAKEISERRGVKVEVGRYVDRCDSLHVYGKDLAGTGGLDGLVASLRGKTMEELTWTSDFARDSFLDARRTLAAQLEAERQGLGKGVVPPGTDLANYPYPAEWDR